MIQPPITEITAEKKAPVNLSFSLLNIGLTKDYQSAALTVYVLPSVSDSDPLNRDPGPNSGIPESGSR